MRFRRHKGDLEELRCPSSACLAMRDSALSIKDWAYEDFLIDVTMPVLSSTVTATLAPTFSLPTVASGDNW